MGYDTRIPIDSDTRDELRGMKEGSETYDDLINRIIKERNEAIDKLDVRKFNSGE